MGIGAISITSPGSVTAPSALNLSVSSALTTIWKDYAPATVIPIPSLRAVLFADGVDFQYHLIDAAQYLNGPLAPSAAPDATSTATRATAVLTFSGASSAAARPSNNDAIQLGKVGTIGNGYIYFKTTLDTTLSYDQVLIGANVDATISNLTKFINGTGTNGTEYFSVRMASYGYTGPGWDTDADIEVSTSTAFSAGTATITFRARTWGVGGNTYRANEVTDAGAVMTGLGGSFTGGAAGTGTTPGAGTYVHAIARVRRADGAQTAISPTDTTQNGGNVNMSVGTFGTPPSRDGVDYTRIFRSTVNGGSVLYQVEDTSSSSYTDDTTDLYLTTTLNVKYDAEAYRPYAAGYPPRFRAGTQYRGSIIGAGAILAAKCDFGTANVTNASKSVTFSSGTNYKEDIIGRTFRVASTTPEYVITDFVESTRVATLNLDYEGGTDASASYVLTDSRDPTEVFWTEPTLVNNWPEENSVKGIISSDSAGVVALAVVADTVAAWTRTGLWQVFGIPDSLPRIAPVAEGVGAYNQGSVVPTSGGVFWLGPDGVYFWSGAGEPRNLSKPDVTESSQPRGIAATLDRINADAIEGIVSVYNPTEDTIRWFVPLDGSTWNSHAIVYDLQTRAFTLDTAPPVTYAAAVTGPDGDFYTLAGDAFGVLWQLNTGTSDGAYGFDPVQSYSSYTAATKTVTVTGTALPTSGDGLVGVPVLKVTTAGAVETGIVSANTSSTFVTVSPFTTAPTTGDKFIFGGIEFRLKTSKWDLGYPERRKALTSVTVSYTPQSVAGQLWCAGSLDNDDPSVFLLRSSGAADYADLSASDGKKLYWLRKGNGERIQIELLALCPGFDVNVVNMVPVPALLDGVLG